jgi:hypothetical protein
VHTLAMRFSIDVVFVKLDCNGAKALVLTVRESVPPLRVVRARTPGAAAIEIAGGEAGRRGLLEGAALELSGSCPRLRRDLRAPA